MGKEKVIIVNKDDKIVSYKDRDDRSPGDIVRISGIWIENEKGEILIAQHSINKKNDPGKWGPAAAGTLEKGETYESNILKEVQEEIGIKLRTKDIQFLGAFYEQTTHQYFVGSFYAKISSDTQFILQKEEVESIRWIAWLDLLNDIVQNPNVYLLKTDRGILKRIQDWKKKFKNHS